eukprot:TRINITY_DN1720_c0_g1_i1.p1 TRINITY_DN1720_c0_g1~~TRINITY_DN1720_c0_g1_i1.p1  ORF type:complete len:138 (-),score=8.35 TRINITY_DN1720_c0_g1_i1:258-671(-)
MDYDSTLDPKDEIENLWMLWEMTQPSIPDDAFLRQRDLIALGKNPDDYLLQSIRSGFDLTAILENQAHTYFQDFPNVNYVQLAQTNPYWLRAVCYQTIQRAVQRSNDGFDANAAGWIVRADAPQFHPVHMVTVYVPR